MSTGRAARVALLVNPTAGRGRGAQAGARVARRLRGAGLAVDDVSAGSAADAATGAARAVADGVDALVVVGGDGAVHLGANATAVTGTALGIVAAGSGNDVARSLGLPVGDPDAAADVLTDALAAGRLRRVDLARYQGTAGCGWYTGVLAAGFDAVVTERANRWSRPRGRLRYTLAIARELPVLRARTYRVRVDGDPLEVDGVLAAVANGPAYGGGMRVAPHARVDDGMLHLVVLGPVGRGGLLRRYPGVFSGAHAGDPAVLFRSGRAIEVDAAGVVGYADGERLGPLPLRCEVVPGALSVLVPVTTGGRGDRAGHTGHT